MEMPLDPEQLQWAYQQGGWLALSVLLLYGAVELLKSETFQERIPEPYRWLKWQSWPLGVRMAVVFASSFGATTVLGMLGGVALPAALASAVPVALLAMLTRLGVKAVMPEKSPPRPNSIRVPITAQDRPKEDAP